MTPGTESGWLAPAVVAATVAALVTVAGLVVSGRRDRKDRHRQLLGAALGEVSAYQEFPFIVRRRRPDQPEAERARISTELSEIQRRLNHHRAVLWIEAPRVAPAYRDLVAATRCVAGNAISRGWDARAASTDGDIHVDDVDLSAIEPYQQAFVIAAADHLAPAPRWLRRVWRWTKEVVPPLLPGPRHPVRGGPGTGGGNSMTGRNQARD